MNSDFSVSLNRDELFALEKLIAGVAMEGPGSSALPANDLKTDTTHYLLNHLGAACSSMRADASPEQCSISFSLEASQADSLASWIGRLTVVQIEAVVDDADAADSASLALWNLMEVLRPVSLHF